MVMTHLDQKRWDLFSGHLLPGWRAHDRGAAAELESGSLLPQAPEDQTSPHRGTHLLVTARQDALVGWHDQLAPLQHYPRMSAAIINGAGHNPQLDTPAIARALIARWLDALRHGSTPT